MSGSLGFALDQNLVPLGRIPLQYSLAMNDIAELRGQITRMRVSSGMRDTSVPSASIYKNPDPGTFDVLPGQILLAMRNSLSSNSATQAVLPALNGVGATEFNYTDESGRVVSSYIARLALKSKMFPAAIAVGPMSEDDAKRISPYFTATRTGLNRVRVAKAVTAGQLLMVDLPDETQVPNAPPGMKETTCLPIVVPMESESLAESVMTATNEYTRDPALFAKLFGESSGNLVSHERLVRDLHTSQITTVLMGVYCLIKSGLLLPSSSMIHQPTTQATKRLKDLFGQDVSEDATFLPIIQQYLNIWGDTNNGLTAEEILQHTTKNAGQRQAADVLAADAVILLAQALGFHGVERESPTAAGQILLYNLLNTVNHGGYNFFHEFGRFASPTTRKNYPHLCPRNEHGIIEYSVAGNLLRAQMSSLRRYVSSTYSHYMLLMQWKLGLATQNGNEGDSVDVILNMNN